MAQLENRNLRCGLGAFAGGQPRPKAMLGGEDRLINPSLSLGELDGNRGAFNILRSRGSAWLVAVLMTIGIDHGFLGGR